MEAAKIPLLLLLGSVCWLLAFEPSSATSDSGPSVEVIRQAVGLGVKPNDLTKLWSTRQPVEVVKQDEAGRPYTVTYTITPELDRIIEVRQPQPQLEVQPKAEPQPEPKPQLELQPEPKPEQKPAPQSEPQPKPESKPAPQSDPQPEPQPEPQPSPATSLAATPAVDSAGRLEPGWNYIPNRPAFPWDKWPFSGQATTFKSNWQAGLAWPNFEIRSAGAPMTPHPDGGSITRIHSVSIPGAEALPSSGWTSTNVPGLFAQSWPFHNPFLPVGAHGTPNSVTSANPMAQPEPQPEPQPSSRPTYDLDALPPLPTVASTVAKTRVINADVGLLPHFRIYTSHRSERPSIGSQEPQLTNSCFSQQDLQKDGQTTRPLGKDSSIDSSIESYLARVYLAPADILAHNGELVKTIVDQSGRVLSVKYVLSDVKGEGIGQGKRPEYEIKRR